MTATIGRNGRLAALAALGAGLLAPAAAVAQPADLPIPAATTSTYPPGVSVRQTPAGPVYVDARGLVLYGMDLRTLIRWSPDPAQYCQGACAQEWEPMLAPAGSVANVMYPRGFGDRPAAPRPAAMMPPAGGAAPAAQAPRPGPPGLPPGFVAPQSAPDWSVIEGPQGLQWVYKGWHMAFTRRGAAAGDTSLDGSQNLTWNTLKFVPPVPPITAPAMVTTTLVGGAHVLADRSGRVLFTGTCAGDCAGWVPLAGGLASRGMGQWTISRSGERAQWHYRGQPVFVSHEADPRTAPANATILRP